MLLNTLRVLVECQRVDQNDTLPRGQENSMLCLSERCCVLAFFNLVGRLQALKRRLSQRGSDEEVCFFQLVHN